MRLTSKADVGEVVRPDTHSLTQAPIHAHASTLARARAHMYSTHARTLSRTHGALIF
jgi:hypothetical protein